MSEKKAKYSFIVVKYSGTETAGEALQVLKGLAKDETVELRDAVAIVKTEKGKVKLHQTQDDSAGEGFLKGGLLGIVLGLLFGPAWLVAGAVSGTAVGMLDKGIKDKLMKELGDNMTSDESALAVLIESADWHVLRETMNAQFSGEIIVNELLPEHMAQIEEAANWQELRETIDPPPGDESEAQAESPENPETAPD